MSDPTQVPRTAPSYVRLARRLDSYGLSEYHVYLNGQRIGHVRKTSSRVSPWETFDTHHNLVCTSGIRRDGVRTLVERSR